MTNIKSNNKNLFRLKNKKARCITAWKYSDFQLMEWHSSFTSQIIVTLPS